MSTSRRFLFGSWSAVRALMIAGVLLAASNSVALADYVAGTWSDNSVHILDDNLNNLSSFTVGSSFPNGIATDGNLIWVGFFTTQEVIAYNYSGVEQFRWSAPVPALQGMELVRGELAVQNGSLIEFYNPFTGAFIRNIPSQGFTIEGLAFDGTYLWQLDDSVIYATDPANGNVITTIPNAAQFNSFSGTGLTASGLNELTIGTVEGDWYKVSSLDGSVLASGNNGLDMFALKYVPEPASVALTGLGLLVGLASLRRRKG